MNTKTLILICLLGYINSQAMKSTCMMDMLKERRLASLRNLQAVKPTCPNNKDQCCNATTLAGVKTEWMSVYNDINLWFKEMKQFITFGAEFLGDSKNGMRAANWKNNTVCKGKTVGALERRLQAVQPKCKEAETLAATLKTLEAYGKTIEADSQKCLADTLRIGAGGSCTTCNKVAPTQTKFLAKGEHSIFIDHATANIVVTSCGRFLQGLYALNPMINALDAMVKSRRLQAVKPKAVDYMGFNVDACMDKVNKGRRLQALKKDAVQSYKECANMSTWYLNNLLMNGGSHKLRLNPAMMAVFDKTVAAIGTNKAKTAWAQVKKDVRTLQAVKPKAAWKLDLNDDMKGFIMTDLTPKDVQHLN